MAYFTQEKYIGAVFVGLGKGSVTLYGDGHDTTSNYPASHKVKVSGCVLHYFERHAKILVWFWTGRCLIKIKLLPAFQRHRDTINTQKTVINLIMASTRQKCIGRCCLQTMLITFSFNCYVFGVWTYSRH
jgi:hypothetical protein